MHLRLIVNPVAGGLRRDRLAAARAVLCAGAWSVDLQESRSAAHVADLAAEAAADAECVGAVIAGGDGTVSAALAGLGDSLKPVGILPLGTGNDLASSLGLPLDAASAASVIVAARTRRIDLGLVRADRATPRRFACAVGIGLDDAALRYSAAVPWLPPRLRYAYGGVRALLAHRPRQVTLAVDGQTRLDWVVTTVVSNTPRYGAGMRINPHALLDDGRLDVCVVGRANRLRLLRLFPTIYDGTHLAVPEVKTYQGRRVVVDADRPIPLCVDGDLTDWTTPVVVEALPGALCVFTPIVERGGDQ
jgi:diacylglycerol kinase (ATP)